MHNKTTKHELNSVFCGAEIANVFGKMKWARVIFNFFFFFLKALCRIFLSLKDSGYFFKIDFYK